MVLSILSLLTRPCLTRRRLPRSTVVAAVSVCTGLGCSMTGLGDLLLGDRGLNLGVGAADELHAREIAEMPGSQGKAQVEELFLGLTSSLLEVLEGELAQAAQIGALHYDATSASWSARVMILVEIGSFCAARRSASRAVFSSTPASSNSTRPGRTTATQNSGLPLPEPMRTSAGFFVTDLSGKTLIQTLPPRLMWRVIAIRAASICRLVIHTGSSACKPYSPNVSVLPTSALPRMRPRCWRRHFTLFGVSMV